MAFAKIFEETHTTFFEIITCYPSIYTVDHQVYCIKSIGRIHKCIKGLKLFLCFVSVKARLSFHLHTIPKDMFSSKEAQIQCNSPFVCAATPYIWASMRENLSSMFANNKGADQPAHPRRLINAFVIHVLECIISKLASSKISFF